MNATDVLIKYWGHTQFRLKQEEIINQVIQRKDTLALLPTGGGKSICYQVPALMQEGICLVISPLISLINDQIRHLQSKGIKSTSICSNMNYSEIDTKLTNCIYGGVKFLYLSPEKLQNNLVQSRIQKMNINLITVDEAHCISEWGHNFRPSYRHISKVRNIIPDIPILALTATATYDVIKDIQKNLAFKEENFIKSSFRRDNISYVVDNVKDKEVRLLKLLNKIKSSVIIYVGTRKRSKDLTNFLVTNNFSANYYHAGLSSEERSKRQENWTKNQTRIMVATNSFGMGIDKPDVKLVVHMDLPSTIEAYFQEAGRAGRNGEKAYAFLLANNTDVRNQENLLNVKHPSINEILESYQNIANYLQIGVDDFPENPLPFNIVKFSKRYKTNTLKTYYILKYLEKEERIKFSEGLHSPSKIKITITSSELYKFQITNKFYDSFIKLLLRSYNNLFNHLVAINEQHIASRFNTSTKNVKTILLKLQELEVLEYQEENNLSRIKFLEARKDLKSVHLNPEIWKERKSYESIKLNHIANYINKKNSCRSQLLLDYFGEEKSNKCGVCDVCTMEKRNTIKDKEFKKISEKIRNLLNDTEMNLLEICDSIADFSEEEVSNILNLLFENDKITKFGSKYQWKR